MFALVEFEEDSGSGDDSSVVRAGAGDLLERGAVGVGELDWVFFASDCACFHAFRLTHDLHCGQALVHKILTFQSFERCLSKLYGFISDS